MGALEELIALGTQPSRRATAQRLQHGTPVDYSKGKGLPLLLAGLANLGGAGLGGYQEGQMDQQQTSALSGLMGLAGQPAPDASGLLTANDAALPGQRQAYSDAMNQRRQTGLAALLSGNPQAGAVGKNLYSEADNGQDMLNKLPQTRLGYAMSQQKLGEGAPRPELGGQTEGVYKAISERLKAVPPKFSVNSVTGGLYDTRTGRPMGGDAGGSGGGYDKRLAPMQEKFSKDLDPNNFRSGVLKGNQERLNAAERLLTLAVDPLTGGPADLTPQQMSEVSTSLATLIGGGGSSEGSRHELTPYTKGRKLSEVIQWFTDEPHGAGQQAFVKQMIDTATRERDVAKGQIRKAQSQRFSGHLDYLHLFPDAAKSQLESFDFDPSEVDFKSGRYTPKAKAPAAPAAQAAQTAPAAGARPRRTANGETREWDGTKWVPVK